jgi:hypothetical protein
MFRTLLRGPRILTISILCEAIFTTQPPSLCQCAFDINLTLERSWSTLPEQVRWLLEALGVWVKCSADLDSNQEAGCGTQLGLVPETKGGIT